MKKLAIVGAGPSGLIAAHAAVRSGWNVALFDSHSKPGGCASYFRREHSSGYFTFDAGATVLSGFGEGQELRKLWKRFGLPEMKYRPLETMHFRLPGEDVTELRTTDAQSWIRSLVDYFPEDSPRLEAFLRKTHSQAERLWKLLAARPRVPIENLRDFRYDLRFATDLAALAPTLLHSIGRSFGDLLREQGFGPRFQRFIEMNLLITLQCGPNECHPLYGAFALFFYPLGTGSVDGGMKNFFFTLLEELKKHPNAQVFMRMPVTKIVPDKKNYVLELADGRHAGPFDVVISSLHEVQTQRLMGRPSQPSEGELESDGAWGAIVTYLGVRDHTSFPEAPFFLHSSEARSSLDAPEGGDVYISVSGRDDETRAPRGARSVTMSSHSHLTRWSNFVRKTDAYLAEKRAAARRQVNHFRLHFPTSEILLEDSGTPLSFERYTRRPLGTVGGVPMDFRHTFFKSPSQRSPWNRVYQIGDTVFPGQSIYACAMGALSVLDKISEETPKLR